MFGELALTTMGNQWFIMIIGENEKGRKARVIINTIDTNKDVVDVVVIFNRYKTIFTQAYWHMEQGIVAPPV
nr:hypothetical protein [Clostridioides sp.]